MEKKKKETLRNLVIYVRNANSILVKTQKHRFPFTIIYTIVPNDKCIHVIERSPQNTDDQHCFSMPCLFCFDFLSFQSDHRNTNKLRTN